MERKSLLFHPILVMLFTGLLFGSCSTDPEPIEYGNDNCHECKMTIVDKRFGAEVVTSKGKVYKFDAIECMVNYYKKEKGEGTAFSHLLVTNFKEPGKFIDAQKSHYLRTKSIPSPMGMFLSAYATKAAAEKTKEESQKGGKIYDWKTLTDRWDNLPDKP